VSAGRIARSSLRYGLWPAVMGGSLVATWAGFAAGFDPALWTFAVSTLTFVVVVALELVLPINRGWTLFRDRQSFNDIGHGVLIGALSRPISLPITVGLVGVLVHVDTDTAARLWPHSWPMVAQVALGLFVWSLPSYWTHRTLHRVERLWWFHALHHDPSQMQVLKGNRIHIGEDLAANVIILVPMLALGAPAHVLLWIAMWNNSEGALAHSNIDLRFPSFAHWVLPTPQNHRLHHAADRSLQDSNFAGITPLWDHVFGTYHHPDRHPVTEFGLGDGATVPTSFTGQLLLPLRAEPAQRLAHA
jgi:sterol desaturase/sphingolipid hydroxylase (fatty acid hydroxylase superfamily)